MLSECTLINTLKVIVYTNKEIFRRINRHGIICLSSTCKFEYPFGICCLSVYILYQIINCRVDYREHKLHYRTNVS